MGLNLFELLGRGEGVREDEGGEREREVEGGEWAKREREREEGEDGRGESGEEGRRGMCPPLLSFVPTVLTACHLVPFSSRCLGETWGHDSWGSTFPPHLKCSFHISLSPCPGGALEWRDEGFSSCTLFIALSPVPRWNVVQLLGFFMFDPV